MPLKSKAQERLLWATNPKLAKKFEQHTTTEQKKNLPEHVSKAKSHSSNNNKKHKERG